MSFETNRPFSLDEVYDPNAELAAADTGYTGPNVETDQALIAEQVFGALADRVQGWQAHDGGSDTWLIEAFAAVSAETRALARSVPEAIFVTFATEVLGRPIRSPSPASAITTWTARDDRGYDIQPGWQVIVPRTGDQWLGFEVLIGGSIPPGQTTIEGVELAAIQDGAAPNGLMGPAELADARDWVESIEVTQPIEGGDDGQDRAAYLDQITNLLRIIAFRPILSADYSLLAMQHAGVGRAVAMDTFDPRDGTWGHARTVTLVLADPDGYPLPGPVMDEIRDEMEAVREINFQVFCISPQYESVDASFEVTAFAEQDAETVQELCLDAVRQLLEPGQWRLGLTSPAIAAGEVIPPPGQGQQPGRQTIRINDLIGRLDRCRGVDFVGPGEVTINGRHEDHDLAGPTTLPTPGQITGTVNVPRGDTGLAQ